MAPKLERDEKGRVKKGSAVLNPKGRKKGALNKVTVEVKKAVHEALHLAGEAVQEEDETLQDIDPATAYMLNIAKDNPGLFLQIVKHITPPGTQQIDVNVTQTELVEVITAGRERVAQRRAAMIEGTAEEVAND